MISPLGTGNWRFSAPNLSFLLQPWHILLAALCGMVNHRQQQIIEFQNAQIEARLNKHRKPGRPHIRQEIVDAIVSFATGNPTWGYDRVQGALKNLGYHIADSSVANVLKAHGIEPAPGRQRTQAWSTFLKAHWNSIFATDFTTVEVWTRSGLVTFYVLAVIHLKTRRVQIVGITPSPNATWMKQVCRNLTDSEHGFLNDASHLIVNRDTSFIALRHFIEQNTDTEVVLLPTKSPNLNGYMER